MEIPGWQNKLGLLACITLLMLARLVSAEPPSGTPSKPAMKVPPAPRERPQIIYHVRPTSDYAATLHSQAKGQNSDLTIDSSMPLSLQLSNANANNAAAEARAKAEAQEKAAANLQQREMKRPKTYSNRMVRPSVVKPQKQHGNPHGPKSHKK